MRRHKGTLTTRRSGFTILEMMIAMVIFLSVMGAAASVFRMQSRAITEQTGRLEAQQNARFALTMIERELRMGGVGLASGQPSLVMASTMGVSFNANLTARDTLDLSAVYANEDADIRTVGVFPAVKAILLPGTTDLYPDTTYELKPGTPGRAETITYWLSRDSTSPRSDEYVLFKRVNYAPAMVVTRGVVVGPTDTVFQYFVADTAPNTLKAVPLASLPATHVAKVHKAADDTGKYALVDSIRAVKVRLRTLFRDPRGNDAIREFAGRVTILNAGAAGRATCGESPFGVTPKAEVLTDADGVSYVELRWDPSVDENGGEKDVERYAVYRRAATALMFDEPIVSIPAGEATYTYQDYGVEPGQQLVYGVASQDCTPASSSAGLSEIVTIPGGEKDPIIIEPPPKEPIPLDPKIPLDPIPMEPVPLPPATR